TSHLSSFLTPLRPPTSTLFPYTTLFRSVRDTAARGGRVLIPAFAVGRTQEILYNLHWLVREGAIPSIPIVVDSPLAIDTTTVFRSEEHTSELQSRENLVCRLLLEKKREK